MTHERTGSTSIQGRSATLRDVAAAAGVAKSTASMALSGNARIAPETRATVLRAARELGFEPNPHAQRLNRSDTGTVALFATTIDPSAGLRKLQSVQQSLTEAGYDVPIYVTPAGQDREARMLAGLRRQRPAAIVCVSPAFAEDALGEIRRYQERGGVVVAYDYPAPALECDQAVFDREHNTYRAARHLLELGHRRLALFDNLAGGGGAGNGGVPSARRSGFGRALAEFGRTVHEPWLFRGYFEEGGGDLARKIAALPQSERPTGLCIVNDYAAAAFLSTAQRLGLRVPEEISVVSHADMPIARHTAPPLTTMTHPIEEIARAVASLVTTRLSGAYDGPARTVVLQGELIRRESAVAAGSQAGSQ